MFFDQYQRYETIGRIINIISEKDALRNIKILEVGANAQKTLEKFVNGEIFFTDIKMMPGMENDDHFFIADATNLYEIENASFDFVVASDVFEHVPMELRVKFISELYRVSRKGVIMCFPIGNEITQFAEKQVNDCYERMFGNKHIWLQEHYENELPRLVDIDSMLEVANIDYFKFEHGKIENWIMLQKIGFMLIDSEVTLAGLQMNELYANEVYNNDIGEENYRVFYCLSKEKKAREYHNVLVNMFGNSENDLTTRLYNLALEGMTSRINIMNGMIKQLVDIVTKQNQIIGRMQSEINDIKENI